MPSRVTRARRFLAAIGYEVRAENLTFMAGSIAYHAFVSLLPLLLLLLAAISAVGSTTLENSFIEFTRAMLTPGASEVLIAELRSASASTGVSVVGVVFLLWGTLRIFRGLDTAFSEIYDSSAENTTVDQFVDGTVVLVTVAAAIVATILVESVVSPLAGGPAGWVVQRLLLVVGLALVFLPMYYVFPDTDGLTVLEVVPGVLIATVGLTTLESLFRLYVEFSSRSPERSVIAAFLVLLTWLYLSGFVILLGAAVNAVTANRSRHVNVGPLLAGVPVEEGASTPVRSELVATLERLDGRLDGAETVVVDVDDESVSLPPPDATILDLGQSGPFLGSGAVRLELYWASRERT